MACDGRTVVIILAFNARQPIVVARYLFATGGYSLSGSHAMQPAACRHGQARDLSACSALGAGHAPISFGVTAGGHPLNGLRNKWRLSIHSRVYGPICIKRH